VGVRVVTDKIVLFFFLVYGFFGVAVLTYFARKFGRVVENIGFLRSCELISSPGTEFRGSEADIEFVRMVNHARATYFVYLFVIGPILILLIHFLGQSSVELQNDELAGF
jgi:hypothetical protein